MKQKWLLGLVLLLQLALVPTAYGLYSGNPADPMLGNGSVFFCDSPWWSPKIGYQRDYITDAKLKSSDPIVSRIGEFDLTIDQAVIAWDFCQRFEIYGTVGAGKLFTRPFPGNFGTAIEKHRDFQSVDGTAWSVGGKAIIFDWCNTIVGIDGKYGEINADFAWDGLHEDNIGTLSKFHYRQWQVSLGAAYNFCCAAPYINLLFNGLTDSSIYDLQLAPVDNNTTTLNSLNLKQRGNVGLAVGTSFIPTESFYVTVECRFINERSLTLQGLIKF